MLRLLHTSDWHLGQLLKDRDRDAEHRAFLDWLVRTLEAREIDALLVAGDLFDGPNPPAAAQRLFFEFLAEARARCPRLEIVLIAGNHDSAARLEAPGPMLGQLGVRVVGRARRAEEASELHDPLVPLHDRSGEVAAWCLAIPFLRLADLPPGLKATDGVTRVYADAVARAEAARRPGQALVAMGHATVQRTPEEETAADDDPRVAPDEERDNDAIQRITIGGLERLPASTFPPSIAYVALGHLHRAGPVGGQARVRYSGSPIPLSFAERTYAHQVVEVVLEGEFAKRIEPILVPRTAPMRRVPQTHAPLSRVLDALSAWTPTPEERRAQVWLELAIDRSEPIPLDVVGLIQRAVEDKPVRAWKIHEPPARLEAGAAPRPPVDTLFDVEQVSPRALLETAFRQSGRTADEELHALLALLEEVAAPS